MSLSVNPVNDRLTKKGNPYKSSNICKSLTAVIWLGKVAGDTFIRRYAVKNTVDVLSEVLQQRGIKASKGFIVGGMVAGVALATLALINIASIGDAIINKIRANKADKKAQQV